MRALFIGAAALVALIITAVAPATAATITVKKHPQQQSNYWVFVEGDIVIGDHDKFMAATKHIPVGRAAVMLTSDGGALYDGLDIGVEIKNKRFNTRANGTCASVCGLIWLAGYNRYMDVNARVGFHGAYNTETRVAVSGGNAIAGAYLSRLGLDYKAIYTLTRAVSDDMIWINGKLANELGIRMTVVK
jgi:hypothetical protein